MLKRLVQATFFCLIGAGVMFSSLLGINCAHAIGIGAYLTYGSGNAEFREYWDSPYEWYELESSGDSKFFGYGFILDTTVAKNRVFNYRLQIGYENAEYGLDSVYNKDTKTDISASIKDFEMDIDRFVLDNTFGFGIVRKEYFRLWIGPQLRIGYMYGDGTMTDIYGTKLDLDFKGVVLGIAPVIGANFNFKNNLTLGVDLGYRFNFFPGDLEKTTPGHSAIGSATGLEDTFFINFALIYRFNDIF